MSKLILASSSPQRKVLLAQVGIIPDQIIPADIDESHDTKESILAYAKRMSFEKAKTIHDLHPDAFVIGADTLVETQRHILHKTDNVEEAIKFLRMLSGKRHRVLTSVTVIAPSGKYATRAIKTIVHYKRLTEKDILEFLKTDEWKGRAGAYSILGYAQKFVKSMSGSLSAVVGLPLYETCALLEGLGFEY
ncbi:Maf-like protein [Candidatus Bealeia paramacronuclearis]|uniref:Nucleoside triphosphate pyrophosphatase n=1 Tax=Candidatus Bealeia paramacronuclearis TaxID=1921001 RepID=A0ABZ2C3Z1_9PROT|nr:Maf-like protein [Candidatus Bealeia paramacronuclearis]